jgi:hypothetical protein
MLRIHKALACLVIGTAVWLAALGRPELEGGVRTAVLLVRRRKKKKEGAEVGCAPCGAALAARSLSVQRAGVCVCVCGHTCTLRER